MSDLTEIFGAPISIYTRAQAIEDGMLVALPADVRTPFKYPVATNGLRVEVYWNVPKKLFSVRALKGLYRGLVCMHTDAILLEEVTFAVQAAGRARVLREKRKNVHAFVRGMLVSTGANVPVEVESAGWPVTYDPYRDTTFVRLVGEARMEIQAARAFVGFAEAGAAKCWAHAEAFGQAPAEEK